MDAISLLDEKRQTITKAVSQTIAQVPLSNQDIDLDLNKVEDFDLVNLPDLGVFAKNKSELNYYQITLKRNKKPGFIRIVLSTEKLKEIRLRIGLQILIAYLENEKVIRYISFLNDQLRIIADSEPSRVGMIEEKQEYLDSLNAGANYFSRINDEMDVIHPIFFFKGQKGVFHFSFPITQINKIMENTIKNVIFFNSWVMILAIIIVSVILKLQQIYSKKMDAMHRKISENQKLVSLANLAAGVAHEVRNPLNSISITIQRLQLEFKPENKDDVEEYVRFTDLMKNEVNRINRIITDFLGFSKPFEPENSMFSIDEFLEESLELFQGEADKKEVAVIKKFNTKNEMFNGDKKKLTQVLVNLLHNSLDASNKNSSIVIKSEISREKDWKFIVQDFGKGLAKEKLHRVFDIYFTTKENGTGLGLYISRKIVQAHKGTLELQSKENQGTSAIVTLPNDQHWTWEHKVK